MAVARASPPPAIRFVKDHLIGLFGGLSGSILKHHPDVYEVLARSPQVRPSADGFAFAHRRSVGAHDSRSRLVLFVLLDGLLVP